MRFLLGFTRTLVTLSLGLWIGGLVFFGAITAAIMFPATRKAGVPQLGPLMVGPMLTRFGWVCTICSGILVVGWLVDGALTKRTQWWKAQGALTLVAVILGVYLNFGLLPVTRRDQNAVLPLYVRSLQPNAQFTPAETQLRERFDSGHHAFNSLASVNIWLLVAALACLMARSLPDNLERKRENKGTSESAPLAETLPSR